MLWNSGAKVGLIKSGAANIAWNLVDGSCEWQKNSLSSQSRYVLVELSGESCLVNSLEEKAMNVAEWI
ncbi:serine/threonine kinase [Salmonella phage 19]|nr:serine/threonine kinase [Salmonella phage 19]